MKLNFRDSQGGYYKEFEKYRVQVDKQLDFLNMIASECNDYHKREIHQILIGQ